MIASQDLIMASNTANGVSIGEIDTDLTALGPMIESVGVSAGDLDAVLNGDPADSMDMGLDGAAMTNMATADA